MEPKDYKRIEILEEGLEEQLGTKELLEEILKALTPEKELDILEFINKEWDCNL